RARHAPGFVAPGASAAYVHYGLGSPTGVSRGPRDPPLTSLPLREWLGERSRSSVPACARSSSCGMSHFGTTASAPSRLNLRVAVEYMAEHEPPGLLPEGSSVTDR